jgi:broad specificity phosphatase PhoE
MCNEPAFVGQKFFALARKETLMTKKLTTKSKSGKRTRKPQPKLVVTELATLKRNPPPTPLTTKPAKRTAKPKAKAAPTKLAKLKRKLMAEPAIIKLVRHGESESNTGKVNPAKIGDHNVKLTKLGKKQAFARGEDIGAEFIREALLYRSPYRRTRQTMNHLLKGAGFDPESLIIFEDPRLREIDTGYHDYEQQQKRRSKLGWFYYRYTEGESPADCFDRMCTFLETLSRQSKRKGITKVLIVSHGLAIRCFIMRFMHLSVEQFESMHNPQNCDVITIAHKHLLKNPQFVLGKWGVEGLRLRDKPRTPEDEKQSNKAAKEAAKAAKKAAKAEKEAAKAAKKSDKKAAKAQRKSDKKAAKKAAKKSAGKA